MTNTTSKTLRDLRDEPPRMSVVAAGAYFGLNRARAYAAARSGTFPAEVHRLGGRYLILTTDIARALGIDPADLLR